MYAIRSYYVSGYGPEGREFESLQARHTKKTVRNGGFFVVSVNLYYVIYRNCTKNNLYVKNGCLNWHLVL